MKVDEEFITNRTWIVGGEARYEYELASLKSAAVDFLKGTSALSSASLCRGTNVAWNLHPN